MSFKRQRFFVEVREGEVTVVSWKKLLAEADRVDTSVTLEAPPPQFPPAPAAAVAAPTTGDDEKNESLKLARRNFVKSDVDEGKMMEASVKHEIEVKAPIIKRKVPRSHNITTAKLKQTKVCFSCSNKIKRS